MYFMRTGNRDAAERATRAIISLAPMMWLRGEGVNKVIVDKEIPRSCQKQSIVQTTSNGGDRESKTTTTAIGRVIGRGEVMEPSSLLDRSYWRQSCPGSDCEERGWQEPHCWGLDNQFLSIFMRQICICLSKGTMWEVTKTGLPGQR